MKFEYPLIEGRLVQRYKRFFADVLLPGGEVVALIDACRRAGIRFYLVGHEASAAFMAA